MYTSFCYRVLVGTAVLLLALHTTIAAQSANEAGLPALRTYSARDYAAGPRNNDILQDEDGLVYVANEAGVLIFDGLRWQLLRLPGQHAAEALLLANKQVVVKYYGGIMLLHPDANGQLVLTKPEPGQANTWRESFERRAAQRPVLAESVGDVVKKMGQASRAITLADSSIAVAVPGKGVYIISNTGQLRYTLDDAAGVMASRTTQLFADREQGLWVTTLQGLARIEYPTRYSYYNATNGLPWGVLCMARHQGLLYAGTTKGLYVLQTATGRPAQFVPVQGVEETAVTALVQTDNELFAVAYNVYQVQGTRATANIFPFAGYDALFYHNDGVAEAMYAYRNGRLLQLDRNGKSWHEREQPVANIIGMASSIVQDKQGYIYLSTLDSGIFRLKPDAKGAAAVQRLGKQQGLPSQGSQRAYRVADRILIGTDYGIYEYDAAKGRCNPAIELAPQAADGQHAVLALHQAGSGRVWLSLRHRRSGQHILLALTPKAGGNGFLIEEQPYARFGATPVQAILADQQGITWMGTPYGLIRYDLRVRRQLSFSYPIRIRQVLGQGDTLLYGGHGQQQVQHTLSDDFHRLRFEVALPSYDEPTGTRYQYRLSGLDEGWTDWVPEAVREFSSLPSGTYVFRVRARNAYGHESQGASYTFRITPAWYNTWWMWALYTALGVGLVYGFVLYRINALRRENKVLDEKVRLRTRQLSEANEEIRLQNEQLNNAYEEIRAQNENLNAAYREIEQKNRDITESITYASRIQQAMLPYPEKIVKLIPEYFVFYQPRDIVSGDFYWFHEKQGNAIIAAVDCTGHGVPGAFMSMIGDQLLDQIVNDHNIIHADLILNELHKGIRRALKQDQGSNRDGMDITICVIDYEERTLEFAGANNPLVYIQDGEVIEVKGDKFAIGGLQLEAQRLFTRHVIPLDKPTTCYLFSDGYQDQFGGDKGRKYGIRQMKELFLAHHQTDMEQQRLAIEMEFYQWRGKHRQLDDVLVLGFRV